MHVYTYWPRREWAWSVYCNRYRPSAWSHRTRRQLVVNAGPFQLLVTL